MLQAVRIEIKQCYSNEAVSGNYMLQKLPEK